SARLGLSACCIVYPSSTKRRHATPNLLGLKPLEATGASVHAIVLGAAVEYGETGANVSLG
ncbi:hypothetical protein, partial [Azotobacter chroococcum]|uniref:hypothetical protein n=1 Tax=Azotobacter chroococcum TaxID=353 RepID=UPI001A953D23